MKKWITGLATVSCLVFLGAGSAFAETTVSFDVDLNMDNVKESVTAHIEERKLEGEDAPYPTIAALSVSEISEGGIEEVDRVEVVGEEGIPLVYQDLKIIDIDPKDKQKEVLLLKSNPYFGIATEADIYSFQEGKLKLLGRISGIMDRDIRVNPKTKYIEAQNYHYHPIQYTYYAKYKLENGTLKTVNENEVQMLGLKKPITPTTQKSLQIYSDKKGTKKAFTLKAKEKFTVLAGSEKEKYLKVKNAKGKVGYLPLQVFVKSYDGDSFSIWRLKQYKNIDIYEVLKGIEVWS
ncbi:MAG: hypothetical protein Q3993_08315 [Filifactor alocis]|nr:hypothetical protein [Filifactor alocis]